MRLDRRITLLLSAAGSPFEGRGNQRRVPILMYHSVSEDPEPGVGPYYRLAISPELFRAHMLALRSAGFRGLSLPEAMDRLGNPSHAAEPVVAITFDDGFRDFLLGAWPILSAIGFSASVFLPTGLIGQRRQSFLKRECLTWDEVRELHQQGVHFGSHSVNHRVLYNLTESELLWELQESRRTLEAELGVPILTFAHPYAFPEGNAAYLVRYRRCLNQSGYLHALTTTIGRVKATDDPFLLKRLPANGADDVNFLLAKVRGSYDWMRLLQAAFRKIQHLRRRADPLVAAGKNAAA